MRAWQVQKVGEPRDALRLVETDIPEPGPGLIRVRVDAAALGLPDVLMCRGLYPLTPPLPFTPGQECCGVVTAVGKGARAKLGDRVMTVSAFFVQRGAFAEEALAVDGFTLPADELSDAEAAGFVIPYHTAWVGLVQRAGLREGETLLVLGGSGGTGAAAIQLGKALGARVIATAGGPEKCDFCRELGADIVIDRRTEDVSEAVKHATSDAGVDVLYDPVGGDAFAVAIKTIAHEGRALVVGFASGSWAQLSSQHIVARNYSVMGVYPSAYDETFRRNAHERLLALARAGSIRTPVHRIFPFEELPEALSQLASGGVLGKAVLAVAPEVAPTT